MCPTFTYIELLRYKCFNVVFLLLSASICTVIIWEKRKMYTFFVAIIVQPSLYPPPPLKHIPRSLLGAPLGCLNECIEKKRVRGAYNYTLLTIIFILIIMIRHTLALDDIKTFSPWYNKVARRTIALNGDCGKCPLQRESPSPLAIIALITSWH